MVRHRENQRHGTAGGDGWTTAGIWIVGITAAAMSWTGWFLLAVMCGWPRPLSGLLPFAVDVYVITSARVWLRVGWVSARTRRFAAGSTFFAVVLSVAANAAYHWMDSLGWRRAPWPVVVVVSGLAPLMMALVAHLHARLNADRTAPAEVAAAVPDAAPEPAPAVAEAVTMPVPVAVPVATEPATAEATEDAPPPRQKTRQTSRPATVSDRGKNRAKARRLVAENPAIEPQELAAKCRVTVRTAQRWLGDIRRPHLVGKETAL